MDNFDLFLAQVKNVADLDTDYALANLGGSPRLYEQILTKAMKMFHPNIAEMERALDAGDLSAFGIKAHGMKGSLNQVGCLRVAKLAEALEKAAKSGNGEFCSENFNEYREEASRFYEQADAALRNAGTYSKAKAEYTPEGDISDFADLLSLAKAAAASFDSRTAAKCLSTLGEYHFGRNIDLLVLQALAEFEAFRPKKALPFIDELLAKCVKKD